MEVIMKQIIWSCIVSCVILSSIHCGQKQQKQDSQQVDTSSRSTDLYASTNNVIASQKIEIEEVSFVTSDGIRISGAFYKTHVDKAPVVLCLHMWVSDGSAFAGIAKKFTAQGIHVLAIDMRGFGKSTQKSNGEKVEPDRMAEPDVEAAVKYLESRKDVDRSKIGILGASYGASNAIIYASKDETIKAVGLLSPGVNYFNVLPTEDAVKKYGARMLLSIASKEDMRSVEAIKLYQTIKSNNHTVKLVENLGHGTNMIKGSPSLESEVVHFFVENLK